MTLSDTYNKIKYEINKQFDLTTKTNKIFIAAIKIIIFSLFVAWLIKEFGYVGLGIAVIIIVLFLEQKLTGSETIWDLLGITP